ncbi:hypothetical protein SAMN05421810_101677 [Amycolatopsis arida]|uniref:PepSY domain-containing protein n=1 Tax=Amycolatopsis arida TaxID=587909 RepID=A0A1I5LUC6_9PSEU|nr:hypothetical protein [Amycolatopsis arida]TDX93853.1 hypothetical protein CLV69_104310 [Amycolatopsis arida]SFP00959.1 hypothetical protein SAMN05421810_101677 [Amycolatopsis arida]
MGFLIESYSDGAYEMEISDASGVTLAQIVVNEHEIISAEPESSS